MGGDAPLDVRPPWLNVARRLQQIACRGGPGYHILSIKVVTDAEGNPRFWTEPTVTRLDGRGNDPEILLDMLGG